MVFEVPVAISAPDRSTSPVVSVRSNGKKMMVGDGGAVSEYSGSSGQIKTHPGLQEPLTAAQSFLLSWGTHQP